jgi:hypothetical protein
LQPIVVKFDRLDPLSNVYYISGIRFRAFPHRSP